MMDSRIRPVAEFPDLEKIAKEIARVLDICLMINGPDPYYLEKRIYNYLFQSPERIVRISAAQRFSIEVKSQCTSGRRIAAYADGAVRPGECDGDHLMIPNEGMLIIGSYKDAHLPSGAIIHEQAKKDPYRHLYMVLTDPSVAVGYLTNMKCNEWVSSLQLTMERKGDDIQITNVGCNPLIFHFS
jgi:hypothetical protein